MKKLKDKKLQNMKDKATKKFILETFIDFAKENNRYPSEAELQKLGVTRNATRWHFDTVKSLKLESRKLNPEAFKNIIDETSFTKKNFDRLTKLTAQNKRFVITTAVAGCQVHAKFYKALKAYCKKNDALMLIIPVKDPAANVSSPNSWNIDPMLADEQVVFGDLALNRNLYVSGIKMSAKQIDPVTGLDRLARDCSFIFGSPKHRMRVLPNAKHKHPHILMSTGAITVPNYHTEKFMSLRTAYLAEFDHKLSALVVELDDKDRFYIRHLMAEPHSGNFVDLGDYYHADGSVTEMHALAVSLGDTHAGEEDKIAMQTWKEVCEVTKPKYSLHHDLFNGKSVNHHSFNKVVTRARMAEKLLTNLKNELKVTAKVLKETLNWTEKGAVIVRSNHDDWLMQYLEDGKFLKDHENFFTATQLLEAVRQGEDALQYGVEQHLSDAERRKVLWLERDQEFMLAGIDLGQHGDKGPNGSRGTLNSLERAYGACVVGHSHTPGILRDAWQNGTSSLLDLEYNTGGSSWMHSSTIVYPNGSRQMIHSIRGHWRLKKVKK